MTRSWVLGLALVLSVDVGFAAAQQAPAQAAPPPPPQAAVAPAPVLPREATPAPPPRPAAVAPAANRAPVFAEPVRPPTPGSALPPDSVRPAAAVAPAEPPANAVARCRDGTFVLPPSDASACATHRGVLVVLPQSAGARPPVAPASRALTPVAATRAAVPDAAPPAGATMRCKDGTYLTGAPAAGRCDANGGVAAVLVAPRTAPPPPLPRRP